MPLTRRAIVFITRKYPPIPGGMETYSKGLYETLCRHASVTLIANPKGNRYLGGFMIRVIWFLIRNNRSYQFIHLGDGLLSPLIWVFGWWSTAKWSITLHGLDVTYPNQWYQWIVKRALNQYDRLVWVSDETKRQCLNRGIKAPGEIIPNGIDVNLDRPLPVKSKSNGVKLYSIGRMVRRKGVKEFIQNVMPNLDPSISYIVAGEGVMMAKIQQSIQEHQLQDRVRILGRISDIEKESLWDQVDVFIMPNIKVPGDMEGFGMTLIEASAQGVPVVARGIEGITSAVWDGKTGYLVRDDTSQSYQEAIRKACLLDPEQIRHYTHERFDWESIIHQYITKIFV